MKKSLFSIFAFLLILAVGKVGAQPGQGAVKVTKRTDEIRKEFEETNSFIKKASEAFKPTLPRAEEAKKEEPPKLPVLTLSPAAAGFYYRQLAKERDAWLSNTRIAFARHGGHWRTLVIPLQGGIMVQYWFRRSYPPSYYSQGIVFVSDDQLMAKWRDKLSSLAKEPSLVDRQEKILPVRKGKRKPL